MNEIVLTAEQASILSSSEGPVAIRRPDGTYIGWVSPKANFIVPDACPFTPEEIAAAESRADGPGPWYTTEQVLEHLKSLESLQS
jgi:hypothetical protein